MSQRLYYNGIILTSTDENPYAQAVLTENGRIKEVFFNNAENTRLCHLVNKKIAKISRKIAKKRLPIF